jgi:hypothetical protein
MEFLDGQESNETTRMDNGASSDTEIACTKENTSKTNCQNTKANRRRNAAKSIWYGDIA